MAEALWLDNYARLEPHRAVETIAKFMAVINRCSVRRSVILMRFALVDILVVNLHFSHLLAPF